MDETTPATSLHEAEEPEAMTHEPEPPPVEGAGTALEAPAASAIAEQHEAAPAAEVHEAAPAAEVHEAAPIAEVHEAALVEHHAPEPAVHEPAVTEPAAEEFVAEPVAEEHVAEPLAVAEPAPAGDLPGPSGVRTVGFDKSVEERRVRAKEHWERVAASKENGEVLHGTVTAVVKGGLRIDIGGVSGFLPASQVRLEGGAALETLVKTKVPLKVIDVDATRKRVVVSHRRAVDDARRTRRSSLLKSLKIGDIHEGTVVRLAPFGAFVDIGGVDGLVPMSELAFERVENVTDVLAVGDKLPVAVLRIEEGGRKIALSRKGALPDPWRDHADVVRQGATVEGKVVAKEPKLQVEIAPGVVGSVRESDADPADYAIGELVEVSVRTIDRRNRRITLTTLHGANAIVAPSSGGFAPLGIELLKKR